MTKATPAPAMAIISRTAAARAGGGEEEIVAMSAVSGDDAVGGEADDAMQVGDRRHDDRGGRATATSDNWRRQLCDGGRRQLQRQSTAGECRCCNGDCDRRATAAAMVGDGGQRQLQRRVRAYSSTAGDGHFGGR